MIAVQIQHGDWETQQDVDAIQAVRDAADPWWHRTHGTNDTTTLYIDPAGLDPVLDEIANRRRSWWRVETWVV
jgi:hypothetical protein